MAVKRAGLRAQCRRRRTRITREGRWELHAYRIGYRQRDVEQLGRYVQSIQENRRIVTKSARLSPEALERWKVEAKNL